MAADHILKVPQGDGEGSSIIIKIKSNGPKQLDLALLATDGNSAWESGSKPGHWSCDGD